MTKFEYLTLAVGNDPSGIFNQFGKEGWELVSVRRGFGYMKRPIEDDKQEAPKEPSQSFVDQVLGVFQEIKDHALTDIFG